MKSINALWIDDCGDRPGCVHMRLLLYRFVRVYGCAKPRSVSTGHATWWEGLCVVEARWIQQGDSVFPTMGYLFGPDLEIMVLTTFWRQTMHSSRRQNAPWF